MKLSPLSKFATAQFWAGAVAIVLGVSVSTNLALAEKRADIEGNGLEVQEQEWERATGLAYWYAQRQTVGALLIYAIAILLAPVPTRDDADTLRRFARRKLSQPLLSDSEIELWSRVLEDSNHGKN
ncbi:hypothetical protein C7293_13700 [filamentous cyanobacterium CCT1]|nr:hypothetical protein C7293_13700 [filamentous cyanobacterium CCT1]PSN80401.1 hypothetical protein C8B47_06755 [filamentous cyanobacterium CCP4]